MSKQNCKIKNPVKQFVRSIPTGFFILMACWTYHRHYYLQNAISKLQDSNIEIDYKILNYEESVEFGQIVLCLLCAWINHKNDKDRSCV